MPKQFSIMPRRTLRNQRGQAVTEFAVILPVLLLVLLAIYQFGVVFNNYIQVTAAAREGSPSRRLAPRRLDWISRRWP